MHCACSVTIKRRACATLYKHMSGMQIESTSTNSILSLVVLTLITQLCGLALSVYKLKLVSNKKRKVHLTHTGSVDLEDGIERSVGGITET